MQSNKFGSQKINIAPFIWFMLKLSTIILLLTLFFSCYTSSSQKVKTVSGRIYATGNEPFVKLAVEISQDSSMIISENSPVYQELWAEQGEYATLKFDPSKQIKVDKIHVIEYKMTKP